MSDLSERITQLSPKRLALLALDLEERLEAAERARREPIAIVGLGCRFPGAEDGPEAFWRLLNAGVDAVAEVPPDRWDVNRLYDPNPDAPGRVATKWGGFLRDCKHFDHAFFGISPREAISLDPQQRLFLEVSWEAFEHAGMAPESLQGSSTGVFVGICNSDYAQLLRRREREAIDAYLASGNAFSVVSGRLSYLLGLQGPSLSVDTACSSSLVAVHLACQSLRASECRMALAGGVNLMLAADPTIALSRSRMMAPDGRCKTFAAAADGFVRGEGTGAVILKRLSDAQADGDRVLAIIRGSAVNQDGRSSGLTAPNGPSQEAVIRAALAMGPVAPADVDYIEAHGTGTTLGDPIEVRAMGSVLGEGRPGNRPLQIGSVKTNIGHLESAAGVAGLIKVVLSLQHEEIPAHLHFKEPNPHIAWSELPVEVTSTARPWKRGGKPRIAGVSSFGFSGTNAHIVVEEAPVAKAATSEVDRPLHLLPLSAKTEAALAALAGRYVTLLNETPDLAFGDVCHTAAAGRSHFEHRAAIVARSSSEAMASLESVSRGERPRGLSAGRAPLDAPGAVFLFTGQGSQYAGMAQALYASQPTFRRVLDRCQELLRPALERPLLDVIFNDTDKRLDQTGFTQPALFALECALAEMWRSWGVEPVAVMGHSVGEFAAAYVAGVFSLEDGLRLIAARARLMQALPAGGHMAAVFTSADKVAAAVAPHAAELSIAAVNAPDETVISGTKAAVDAACATLGADGIRVQVLPVSHAFHSPLMAPMLDAFRREASTIAYAPPRIALVSNLTGDLLPAGTIPDADYWCRHVMAPVQFASSVQALHRHGHRVFLEIGPHPTLIGLGRRCVTDDTVSWLPSIRRKKDDWQTLLGTVGTLYVQGVHLDWKGFDGDYHRTRVTLPTYPFERHYFWPEGVGDDEHALGARRETWRDWMYELAWEADETSSSAEKLRAPGVVAEAVRPELDRQYAEQGAAVYNRLYPRLDEVCSAYIVSALREMGCPLNAGDRFETTALAQSLGVVEIHHRLFARLLEILEEDGWLSQTGSEWRVVRAPEKRDASAMMQELLQQFPECRAELAFTATSAPELAGVLRGTRDPIQVLFPAGSLSAAEAVYERAPGLRMFNTIAAQSIASAIADRPSGRPLRVLEIGAGTGGTSTYVLPQLPAADTDYVYTDVSSLFTARAQEKFSAYPFITYRTLDIEQDPAGQGYLENSFDIVIGANVLHATVDLARTMTNVRKLLAPGGLLVLLETTKKQRFGDLTVGYTDGWWRFADVERRPSYALLTADGWRMLLSETGFSDALAIGGVDDGRAIVANQALVLARAPIAAGAARDVAVVCGDEGRVTTDIVAEERQRGTDVVTIVRGREYGWRDANTCVVDAADAAQWARLFGDLAERFPGRASRVLNLWPTAEQIAQDADVNAVAASVERASKDTLHLTQACAAAGAVVSKLVIATQHTHAVAEPPAPLALAQAPLWGFGRAVQLEHPELQCTLIDLPAQVDASSARAFCDAVDRHDTGERQLAVRDGNRFVHRMVRSGVQDATAQPVTLRPDASYLITGGLSGLGLLVAGRLAEQGARSLVLVGRRAPQAEAQSALAALRARGVEVSTVAADVSDESDMARVFEAIRAAGRPLRGIVHSAGATDDASVLQQQWSRFANVMAAKVRGSWLLHQASSGMPLDFFVLFSTGASFLGSPGQSNHAAANMFMDALAHHRRALGLPALSINWGAWSELGAATRGGVVERVETRGLRSISPDAGLDVLQFLMGTSATQTAVLPIDWPEFIKATSAGRPAPVFSRVAPRPTTSYSGAAPSAAAPGPSGVAALQAMTPQRARATLLKWINEDAARVLGVDPGEAIDPARPLNALGLDSLMAVDLRNALGTRVDRTLPATLLFNYPTIGELLEYLSKEVLGGNAPPEAAVAASAQPAVSTEALDDMSEDELAALLAGKLSGV